MRLIGDSFVKWTDALWNYAQENQGKTSGWEASGQKERIYELGHLARQQENLLLK